VPPCARTATRPNLGSSIGRTCSRGCRTSTAGLDDQVAGLRCARFRVRVGVELQLARSPPVAPGLPDPFPASRPCRRTRRATRPANGEAMTRECLRRNRRRRTTRALHAWRGVTRSRRYWQSGHGMTGASSLGAGILPLITPAKDLRWQEVCQHRPLYHPGSRSLVAPGHDPADPISA